jgi:flagellar assembly protein FliH
MADIFKAGKPGKDRLIELGIDPSKQLSVFERKMLEVKQEAETMRIEAEKVAETIVASARSEADGIREKAYTEGTEKGKSESLARLDDLAKSIQEELEKIQATHSELLSKARSSIIGFTFKLAKLIIGSEISNDPSIVEKHLERILARMKIDGKVEITVCAEDFETIETYLRETAFNMDNGGYEIKVDDSLSRGGVKVFTPIMGIDGSLEGMMQRVESVIHEMLTEND